MPRNEGASRRGFLRGIGIATGTLVLQCTGDQRRQERNPAQELSEVHVACFPRSAWAWYLEGHFTSS